MSFCVQRLSQKAEVIRHQIPVQLLDENFW